LPVKLTTRSAVLSYRAPASAVWRSGLAVALTTQRFSLAPKLHILIDSINSLSYSLQARCSCNTYTHLTDTTDLTWKRSLKYSERKTMHYNLRPRYHDLQLMRKSAYVNNSLFIVRMLL